MSFYRTHLCSELTIKNLNQEVTLSGWIDTIRDHGNLIFIEKDFAFLSMEESNVDFTKDNFILEVFELLKLF